MVFAIACVCVQGVQAQQVREDVAQKTVEQSALSVAINGNTIRIQNASPGAQLEVYSVLGVRVLVVKLDAPDKTFTLNLSKGCYMLKIENVARKVVLK